MDAITWRNFIGDIDIGRKNLGEEMPVSVYRLFEFTMKDVLVDMLGKQQAIHIFREAGKRAGQYFTQQVLQKDKDIHSFLKELQETMKTFKIGILRIEELQEDATHMIVSISEDLDCSGLPVIGETVCNYDEGFLMGVLKEYTGKDYKVIEVDCWAKGGRVCRFDARLL